MPDPTTFADWVRRRRKALDLTQAALAERVGCATVTIRKIEQGMRRPSRQLAELLAEHLAIPAIQRDQFLRLARGEYVEHMPCGADEVTPPAFLQAMGAETRSAAFVAREQELAELETHLIAARSGNGHVVFVTGEAGSGKTALVQEFSRRAQAQHPDLIVATGTCTAYHGLGAPYLPFRQILGLLTGDVEARWMAGTLTRDHALRLWHLWPAAVKALVEHGPDLIDTFVPGRSLIERATAYLPNVPGWLALLQEQVARRPAQANGQGSQQRRIYEEYSDVLAVLAAQQPLLLILDDLHGVDLSSSGLLFHLGQRLGDPRARILIIGTYRPEDVAVGRAGGGQHPLALLLAEFKRRFGNIWINLDQTKETQGRRFLDALLDAKPNRLDHAFRHSLFRHTEGHALFAVELLRDMQVRRDLVQDATGRWMSSSTLSWSTVPSRVQGRGSDRAAYQPAGRDAAHAPFGGQCGRRNLHRPGHCPRAEDGGEAPAAPLAPGAGEAPSPGAGTCGDAGGETTPVALPLCPRSLPALSLQ
jgi:transcriptional regulator with XRE-family HTH domain